MVKVNKIYCGDNLKILKTFPSNSVDLIYIDPPFYSGKNYDLVFGDKYAVQVFKDTFEGKIQTYLPFMKRRIRQLHRILKPTGSFYLHCDWHAGHYLKVECDKIFGVKNFQNEIVWCYRTGGATKKRFSRKHDTIFFYSKTKNFNFNSIKDRIYYEKAFFNPNIDEQGRYYADVLPVDFWQIPAVINVSKERLGYPTQKPKALLEKIINASSNEGDIVLDAFAGCGTALDVAKKLNRKWIGIDVSPIGCTVMAKRLEYKIKDIQGMKYTLDEAKELDWLVYQIWSIVAIGGIPHRKKGSDTGIDGWHTDNKFEDSIPIEVKQGNITRPHVQKLNTVIEREKKKGGVMIGFHITKPAIVEASRIKNESGIEIIFIEHEELYSLDKWLLTKKGLTEASQIVGLI